MVILARGNRRAGDTTWIIPCFVLRVGRLSYGLQTRGDFFDRVTLQDVAFLDSGKILQPQAALRPGFGLPDVVLEMFEARNASLILNSLAAQQPDPRTPRDAAIGDDTTRHRRSLGKLEHLAHFRVADDDFLRIWLQQAFHRFLDLLNQLINDGVQLNLYILVLRRVRDAAFRFHTKPDDDGGRGAGEQDIIFRDAADRAMDDLEFDLLALQLAERIGDGFELALHVGLEHEVQLLPLAILELRKEVFEPRAAGLSQDRALCFEFALLAEGPGFLIVLHDIELCAGIRQPREANDLYRR